MPYQVQIAKPALKATKGVDRPTRERIRKRLGELANSPLAPRIGKPLVNMEHLRSSGVGDWRILYAVNENAKIVRVYEVRPRGQAYR